MTENHNSGMFTTDHKHSRKGFLQYLLFLNPTVLLGGLALLAFLVLGALLVLFFDKIVMFALIVGVFGIGYAAFRYGGSAGAAALRGILPIMALGVASILLFNVMGLGTGAVIPETGAHAEVNVSDSIGGVPTVSTKLAPRTYRDVQTKVCNEDPNLPLVTDGALLYQWVGQCSGDNHPKFCGLQAGDTITLNRGWGKDVESALVKALNENHIGITGQKPDEAKTDLWKKTTHSWKDVAVQYNFNDQLALWSQSACKNSARDDVDCSRYQKCKDFGTTGYVWADQGVEVPSSHKLNTIVLAPAKAGTLDRLARGALMTVSLGAFNDQEFRVVSNDTERVNVVTPEIEILVTLGALGILLSLALSIAGFDPTKYAAGIVGLG